MMHPRLIWMQTAGQYHGWPITVSQLDNYKPKQGAWLPEVQISGMENPVVEVFNQETNELEYVLRVNGQAFNPWVSDSERSYRIRVGNPDTDTGQAFDFYALTGASKFLHLIGVLNQ